jgi:subtilisin family serine protease
MSRAFTTLVGGLALALCWAAPAGAETPDGVIVRYEQGTGPSERAEVVDSVDAAVESDLPLPRMELLDVEGGAKAGEVARELEHQPGVAYAEPDGSVQLQSVPDDPDFRELWAFDNDGSFGLPFARDADIDATDAWNVTTGSRDIPVGVMDSGMDYTHPDLIDNVWVNPGESGGRATNRDDDDDDGYVDDAIGWDFLLNSPAPLDQSGHGTHVAGTIGARGNNGKGVTGVEWNAALMPLRVCDAAGSCNYSSIVRAIAYAEEHGARVVNGSFAGSYSDSILDAIESAPGVLFVFSAGNDGQSTSGHPVYPCGYELPNVICVAATGLLDDLIGISNFGPSVDIAAPGEAIYSTYARNMGEGAYAYMDGTSMAAPQVSGAAALLLSKFPGESASQIRQRLLTGADRPSGLLGKVQTGRLNVARAMGVAPSAGKPNTKLTKKPRRTTSSRRVRFGFKSSSAAGFDCRMDDAAWAACVSPLTQVVDAGSHRFKVRARTATGELDPSPASARFRVRR